MPHIAIVGVGTIGATVAYSIAVSDPTVDVSLVDPNGDLALGHGLDLESGFGHASHAVGAHALVGSPLSDPPAVPVYDSVADLGDADEDIDAVIVAASAPRPSGTGHREGRLAQLDRNSTVIAEIGRALSDAQLEPVPVVVVTNPLDQMVYLLWRETDASWTREKFVGYSLSETARLARALARHHKVAPKEVDCPIMGQHGEVLVPIFSRVAVRGESVDLDREEEQTLLDEIRDIPYDIIQLRGVEETSRWVSGLGVSLLTRSIVSGGPDEAVCLSTLLDGEYGYEDVALSVPVRPSSGGIDRIVEWSLSERERTRLGRAYESVAVDTESL
jgi:malate dehydrogenase